MLLEQGADSTITDNDNATPYGVALEQGQDRVARFLKLAGLFSKALCVCGGGERGWRGVWVKWKGVD